MYSLPDVIISCVQNTELKTGFSVALAALLQSRWYPGFAHHVRARERAPGWLGLASLRKKIEESALFETKNKVF